jgi:uncharacterized protein (TIGR03083 family)
MTTTTENPVALLSRALDQTGAVIARVRPEQAALPTPCRSWDVRALVNHVVDEAHRFAEVASAGKRGPSEGDVIGDDWDAAYRTAADALVAAWQQPGALDRTHRLPGGEIPATWAQLERGQSQAAVPGRRGGRIPHRSGDADPRRRAPVRPTRRFRWPDLT